MTLINGVWYDTEPITENFPKDRFYLNHYFELLPNELGIKIVKCDKCKLARMYILLMNKECDIERKRIIN